ncbi:adenylate kinase 4 [Anaeramoeba flamelloides]|uniref:Adenylate kinase 4 n=1 Tax=Anaeramoeba flamelloides TaxID=1746091 RepID=A0ABQ8YUF5_9EUKA|nr:adenylate kinase 4 [Anaeramoeba flamelloides]
MKKVFLSLLGPPGCGKGTQSALLKTYYNIPHVSIGSLIKKMKNDQSSLGKEIRTVLQNGKLLSGKNVNYLLGKRFQENDLWNGAIFDATPCTIETANMLSSVLQQKNQSLTCCVLFQINPALLYKRVLGRLIHPQSGRIYHRTFKPPKVQMRDDITGEALIQRKDDTKGILNKRIAQYMKYKEIMENYFQKKDQLIKIDASLPPNVVFQKIISSVSLALKK